MAEMDFDLAEPIVEAVHGALAIGDCGYGHKGDLGEAFSAFAGKRLRWSPDPSRIFAIPDVMTGIAEVIQAVTPPGSGIVINPPVYQPFFYRLRLAGRRAVEAPLRRLVDGRYDLDPEALDRALAADGVRAYLLCSPLNPTGRVWSRQQLITAADICQRRGSSATTCRAWATCRQKRASSPGSTAGRSASARIRRPRSWLGAGWPSAPVPASARRAMASRG